VGSRKKMSFRSKVSCEDAMDFEKALRMLGRLEALHSALSLSGRLMRVLRAVVQVSALPMNNFGHDASLGSPIAAQFVGDDHSGRPTSGAQQLAEKSNSGKTVTTQ
jgi:hypothetical protein